MNQLTLADCILYPAALLYEKKKSRNLVVSDHVYIAYIFHTYYVILACNISTRFIGNRRHGDTATRKLVDLLKVN